MRFIVLLLLAFISMLFFALKRGPDRTIVREKTAYLLFWASLTVLTLYGAIWFVFGIGEISTGISSRWIELIPAVLVYGLVCLTWFRPLEGGFILTGCGLLAALAELMESGFGSLSAAGHLTFSILPMLIAGLLLILAGFLVKRRLKVQNNENDYS
jgi:hypothetical protein